MVRKAGIAAEPVGEGSAAMPVSPALFPQSSPRAETPGLETASCPRSAGKRRVERVGSSQASELSLWIERSNVSRAREAGTFAFPSPWVQPWGKPDKHSQQITHG